VNEVGDPSQLILNTARARNADLVVVGSRGRSRMAETLLGSVSHRVLLHAEHSTLVVKGDVGPVQRVLVAVEGKDDGERITQWLLRHPFINPVELRVLSVVVPLKVADPYQVAGVESWSAAATTYAQDFVNTIGASLRSSQYVVKTHVVTGEVAATVAEQAKDMDLVVVSSHGRHGVDRFLLGSVSQSVVHRVADPILVVR
ncbi:MAG TPA: universal stress protein, partial [Nitrospira sp.]